MSYVRPAERAGALRLHLNENTAGCSPAVLEAIAKITPQEVAVYPDYAPLVNECAAYLGIEQERLVLTNGLDEGLLAATVTAFAGTHVTPEAIVPAPAFEMYSVFVQGAGGRVVSVPPGDDFAFPLEEVRRAVTAATRAIFLTTPNNPTGQLIPREAIRALADGVPKATVLIDEAYFDFCGVTFLPDLEAHPNVLIGRTFAKAHGLAGLRAGCLIGDPGRLASVRSIVPPFSMSVFAVAGWRAALKDRAHLEWYRHQVEESRVMLYAACERLDLGYWKSAGNFVLIDVQRIGRSSEIVDAFADRGVLVRDRSRDFGCEGCIRITAGVVEHTRAAIAVLEDLCAAR